MTIEKWLEKANNRLRGRGVRLEASGRGEYKNLYLRATLPNKPGKPPGRSQQRIALKIKAFTERDVKRAEAMALEIALDLHQDEFDWRKFGDYEEPDELKPKTIGDLAKELEQEKRHKLKQSTWRYNYEKLLLTLPLDEEPTVQLLYNWVLENDPNNSTKRKNYVYVAKGILALADLPTSKLDKLSRDIATKAINPRLLPEDEEIENQWKAINDYSSEWGNVFGMLAVYGLRPHELFRLDLSNFPNIRVTPEAKTGERIVLPLHEKWVDEFQLSDRFLLPSKLRWSELEQNVRLGRRITAKFVDAGWGSPYNLRHAYSRRCIEYGMSSDIAAKLMGHGRSINEARYQAFVKNSVYLDAAKRIIDGRSQD